MATDKNIHLNIKTTSDNKLDHNKQIQALMPNLIHSLDALSLTLLYNKYTSKSKNNMFYSIHDCFAVTAPNVVLLKKLLTMVYTDIYINDKYLLKFDKFLLNMLIKSDYKVDLVNRKVTIPNSKKPYKLFDIDWVRGKLEV